MSAGYTHKSRYPLEDVKFVTDFAKSQAFVDPQRLFYLGHSWGGGIGIKLNCDGMRDFKRYIIFEATIEHYGLYELSMTYPNLDSVITRHGSRFQTPTTVVTARGSYYEGDSLVIQPFPRFLPYRQYFDQEPLTYLTFRAVLNHDSFTSTGVIRSVFANKYPQSDSTTISKQFAVYQDLVRLTKNILLDEDLDKNLIIKQ